MSTLASGRHLRIDVSQWRCGLQTLIAIWTTYCAYLRGRATFWLEIPPFPPSFLNFGVENDWRSTHRVALFTGISNRAAKRALNENRLAGVIHVADVLSPIIEGTCLDGAHISHVGALSVVARRILVSICNESS